MFKKIIFGLALGLICSSILPAQEMAMPKPGPEHAKIKELEGNWDVVMETMGQKTNGKATYKSICNGMWLANDFEGEMMGAKFYGHGLDGYDIQKKKYVGVWVDSMSSSTMTFEGDYDAKTKLLVMTGDCAGPDGKPQKFKSTTEMKDKDHFTFKMYMLQPAGKEELAFTIEYTRKK